MNEVLKVMKERVSVKSYKPDPVPRELIEQIVEAGLRAPSGLNKQTAIVLAVTNKELRDQLSFLNAGKDPFKRSDPFYGAPCVLVVLAEKSAHTYVYDGSLVMENMLLAAEALGLGACWIHRAKETFEAPEGKAILEKLGINGDYEGIGNCIIGYPNVRPEPKPCKEGRAYYIE